MTTTAVREYPMLFSQQFIPKLLDGTKTQTRRPFRPQPPDYIDSLHGNDLRGRAPYDLEHPETGDIIGYGFQDDNDVFYKIPYRVGDVIWVRETWRMASINYTLPESQFYTIQFRNFGVLPHPQPSRELFERLLPSDSILFNNGKTGFGIWRPSIHMPRWAARIFLRVTELRVERLQELSSIYDVEAEGIDVAGLIEGFEIESDYAEGDEPDDFRQAAVERFAKDWDTIYPKYPWKNNPWVSVTAFELVKP